MRLGSPSRTGSTVRKFFAAWEAAWSGDAAKQFFKGQVGPASRGGGLMGHYSRCFLTGRLVILMDRQQTRCSADSSGGGIPTFLPRSVSADDGRGATPVRRNGIPIRGSEEEGRSGFRASFRSQAGFVEAHSQLFYSDQLNHGPVDSQAKLAQQNLLARPAR